MITKGNITEKAKNDPRGWFLGHFIPEGDFFHSTDFELKYVTGRKGEIGVGSTTSSYRKTLTILISGKIEMYFPETGENIILSEPFDYIADDSLPGAHETRVLEDCVILGIRTPSKLL